MATTELPAQVKRTLVIRVPSAHMCLVQVWTMCLLCQRPQRTGHTAHGLVVILMHQAMRPTPRAWLAQNKQ